MMVQFGQKQKHPPQKILYELLKSIFNTNFTAVFVTFPQLNEQNYLLYWHA